MLTTLFTIAGLSILGLVVFISYAAGDPNHNVVPRILKGIGLMGLVAVLVAVSSPAVSPQVTGVMSVGLVIVGFFILKAHKSDGRSL